MIINLLQILKIIVVDTIIVIIIINLQIQILKKSISDCFNYIIIKF